MRNTRKRNFGLTLAQGELTLAKVASRLGTTQTALLALHDAGQLGALLRPRGRELVSSEAALERWLGQTPRREALARRIRRSPPPDVFGRFKPSPAHRWWLDCLWYRTLTGGRVWEPVVPESELAQAFREGAGQERHLMDFLSEVCPADDQPSRVRYKTRWIADGRVMRGDRDWLVMPGVDACRRHWSKMFGAPVPWELAAQSPDPEPETHSQSPRSLTQAEQAERELFRRAFDVERDAFGHVIDPERERWWNLTPFEEREDQQLDALIARAEAEPDPERQRQMIEVAREAFERRRDKAGVELAALEPFRLKMRELEERAAARLRTS